MKKNTRILVECAVMLAAATALSFVKFKAWSLGGGITLCSMLPLIIIARRHGTKVGLLTAFAHSVLQMIFGLNNVGYATSFVMGVGIVFFDYIAAYTVVGLSDIFCSKTHEKLINIIIGIVYAMTLRLICHFISGWWIWEELWPNELSWASWIWSLAYNGSYMVPEIIITSVAAAVLNTKTNLMDKEQKNV